MSDRADRPRLRRSLANGRIGWGIQVGISGSKFKGNDATPTFSVSESSSAVWLGLGPGRPSLTFHLSFEPDVIKSGRIDRLAGSTIALPVSPALFCNQDLANRPILWLLCFGWDKAGSRRMYGGHRVRILFTR
jgi:hypothetical protein